MYLYKVGEELREELRELVAEEVVPGLGEECLLPLPGFGDVFLRPNLGGVKSFSSLLLPFFAKLEDIL